MSDLDREQDPFGGARPSAGAYDPELPFLARLEREVARSARQAARERDHATRRTRAAHTKHTHAPGRPGHTVAGGRGTRAGELGPVSTRVARRSLTLVGLLCLIGASAYGAHLVLTSRSDSGPSPTSVPQGPFVAVAAGGAGSERWSLRLYRRGDDVCRVLVVEESEASRCAIAPGAEVVGVSSAVSPLRRYFFGVTGSDVARVRLRVGGLARTALTRAPNTGPARAAGLPARVRYFVAIVPRPVGSADPPALVRGLDAAGSPVGSVHVDCSQGSKPRPCPPS